MDLRKEIMQDKMDNDYQYRECCRVAKRLTQELLDKGVVESELNDLFVTLSGGGLYSTDGESAMDMRFLTLWGPEKSRVEVFNRFYWNVTRWNKEDNDGFCESMAGDGPGGGGYYEFLIKAYDRV